MPRECTQLKAIVLYYVPRVEWDRAVNRACCASLDFPHHLDHLHHTLLSLPLPSQLKTIESRLHSPDITAAARPFILAHSTRVLILPNSRVAQQKSGYRWQKDIAFTQLVNGIGKLGNSAQARSRRSDGSTRNSAALSGTERH